VRGSVAIREGERERERERGRERVARVRIQFVSKPPQQRPISILKSIKSNGTTGGIDPCGGLMSMQGRLV
jgi:hypothetical protein